MAGESRAGVTIELLQQENPDSPTLAYLLSPEGRAREAKRHSNVYTTLEAGDWPNLLHAEVVGERGTISPMGALALYILKVHPEREEPAADLLDSVRRLDVNEPVAQYGLDVGRRLRFDPMVHGRLAGRPGVVAYDDAFRYGLALPFTDHARPVEASVDTGLIAVGDDEISELYAHYLSGEEPKLSQRFMNTHSRRLKNAAVMARLGLGSGIGARFETEREMLVANTLRVTNPFDLAADLAETVELLPYLHALAPEVTEDRIDELARSGWTVDDEESLEDQRFTPGFIDAVAAIRSPHVLVSLGRHAAETVRAMAALEIHAIAASEEYVELMTPAWNSGKRRPHAAVSRHVSF